MKKLSVDVVNTVAEFLILTFGKTTTLDVKMMLRKLDFEAKQAEVSELMAQIKADRAAGIYEDYQINGQTAEFKSVDVTTNGTTHKSYFFETVQPVAVAVAPAAPVAAATKATKGTPVSARDYIAANRTLSSAVLATTLGISKGSVAAFKANLNR